MNSARLNIGQSQLKTTSQTRYLPLGHRVTQKVELSASYAPS